MREPTNADHLRLAHTALTEARHRVFAADSSPEMKVAGTFIDNARQEVNMALMRAIKTDPIEDAEPIPAETNDEA